MKNCCIALLVLTFLLAGVGNLSAQDSEQTCIVALTGQNQNRTVDGAVNVECGQGEPHSVPFGNWGVASNYGKISDTDQFRGWKHEDGPPTKRQWNSCTTYLSRYRAPNCTYYNSPNAELTQGCVRQRSTGGIVTHGTMLYRRSTSENCDPTDVPGATPTTYIGCQEEGRTVGQDSNYMTLL